MDETFVSSSADYAMVHGNTTINHRVRCKLKLTCDQYIVLELLNTLSEGKLKIGWLSQHDWWKKIGMKGEIINKICDELIYAEYLGSLAGEFILSTHFRDAFADPELESQFNHIWKEIWKCKGNKATAWKKWQQVRKHVEYSVLLATAKKYQEYKDSIGAERQFRMGFEVWLNPTNKHWEDIFVLEGDKITYKFGEG